MHVRISKAWMRMQRKRLYYPFRGNANKKKPPLEGNLVKQAQLKTQKNPLIQQFHF